MKHLLSMKTPYDAIVWIAGMAAGGLVYVNAGLHLLDVTYFITWEKVIGLLWGLLVALLTGMFALFGKKIAETLFKKYNKSKNNGNTD